MPIDDNTRLDSSRLTAMQADLSSHRQTAMAALKNAFETCPASAKNSDPELLKLARTQEAMSALLDDIDPVKLLSIAQGASSTPQRASDIAHITACFQEVRAFFAGQGSDYAAKKEADKTRIDQGLEMLAKVFTGEGDDTELKRRSVAAINRIENGPAMPLPRYLMPEPATNRRRKPDPAGGTREINTMQSYLPRPGWIEARARKALEAGDLQAAHSAAVEYICTEALLKPSSMTLRIMLDSQKADKVDEKAFIAACANILSSRYPANSAVQGGLTVLGARRTITAKGEGEDIPYLARISQSAEAWVATLRETMQSEQKRAADRAEARSQRAATPGAWEKTVGESHSAREQRLREAQVRARPCTASRRAVDAAEKARQKADSVLSIMLTVNTQLGNRIPAYYLVLRLADKAREIIAVEQEAFKETRSFADGVAARIDTLSRRANRLKLIAEASAARTPEQDREALETRLANTRTRQEREQEARGERSPADASSLAASIAKREANRPRRIENIAGALEREAGWRELQMGRAQSVAFQGLNLAMQASSEGKTNFRRDTLVVVRPKGVPLLQRPVAEQSEATAMAR